MPWNESYFPRSMINLEPEVRTKAIEIANALLSEGYEQGRAISIAVAQAWRWAYGSQRVHERRIREHA